jgi:outer membrane protein assembly factor BamD (BamD/ComL family)
LSREAENNIAQLRDKEVESYYNIGLFYEKQKAYKGAQVYYEDIMKKAPNSPWAAKSLERLRIIERKI